MLLKNIYSRITMTNERRQLTGLVTSGVITVDCDNEFKAARNDAEIETLGLGTGVGIAVYNHQNKVGHLAHLVTPYSFPDTMDAFMASVLSFAKSTSLLKVCLRGGHIITKPEEVTSEEYSEMIAAGR